MLLCDLCGDRSLDVRPGLVAWIDAAQPYAHIDRCTDRRACRHRVELGGQRWPELDRGSEYGRLLAERDRLIASGVDPASLLIPDKPR